MSYCRIKKKFGMKTEVLCYLSYVDYFLAIMIMTVELRMDM